MTTDHYEMLLQTYQVDISQLERPQLEALFNALLEGCLKIFEGLGAITQQSRTIEAQAEAIEKLKDTVHALNRIPEPTEPAERAMELESALVELLSSCAGHENVLYYVMDFAHRVGMHHGDMKPEAAEWWRGQQANVDALFKKPQERTDGEADSGEMAEQEDAGHDMPGLREDLRGPDSEQ